MATINRLVTAGQKVKTALATVFLFHINYGYFTRFEGKVFEVFTTMAYKVRVGFMSELAHLT
jgi:hypothetical protein